MKLKQLDEIAEIINGQSPPSLSYNKEGDGLPFFQRKADFGTIYPKIRVWCNKPKKIAEPDDILVSVRAPVGPININNEKACIGRGVSAIRAKSGFETKYIYYFFKFYEPVLSRQGQGSTFSAITQKDLRSIKIPVVPLETQKQIVTVLDKAEGLIEKRQKAQERLDKLLRNSFLDMFGNPNINDKNWKKESVIEHTDCIVPSRDKPKSFTGDIPWINTIDLKNLGFISDSKEQIGLSSDEIHEVRAKIIPKESVIMTCVGDLGILSINNKDVVVNQQLHTFQCKKHLNPIFLMYALSFQKHFMYRMASFTTIAYMNKRVCNSIPIIIPPKKLQDEFAKKVLKVNAIKAKQSKHLKYLNTLFQSLLQQAFKGKLIFVDERVEIEKSLNTVMQFQKQLDALKPFHEHAKKLQTIQDKFKDIFDKETFRNLRQLNEKFKTMNLPNIEVMRELQRKMEKSGFSNLKNIPSLENIEAIRNSELGQQLQIDKAIRKAYIDQQKRIEEETGKRKKFIKKVDWGDYSVEQIEDKIIKKFSGKYFTIEDINHYFEDEAGILVKYDSVYDKDGNLEIKGMKDFFFENLQGENALFEQHFVQLPEHYNEQFFQKIMGEKEEREKEAYKMFLSIRI